MMILVLLGMLDFSTYTNFRGKGAAQNEKWQHWLGRVTTTLSTTARIFRTMGEREREIEEGMTLTVLILFASFWCWGCETFECEIKW